MSDLKRLRWRCRRGMRELDLVMSTFLDSRYEHLSVEQQEAFAQLLEENDMDIMDWIMGKAVPEDETVYQITRQLGTLFSSDDC